MKRLGLPFEVVVPEVDESFGRGPLREELKRVAALKGRVVAETRPEATVVAADTIVEVGGQVLGKPRDAGHARQMLRLLSGTRQEVHTGVAVFGGVAGPTLHVETTVVVMRHLAEGEIEAYVASGESEGKAGAYAIQENGDAFVDRLEGDFDNVVGLPVEWLRVELGRRASGRGL